MKTYIFYKLFVYTGRIGCVPSSLALREDHRQAARVATRTQKDGPFKRRVNHSIYFEDIFELILRGFFEENVVKPAITWIDLEAPKRIEVASGMHDLPIECAEHRLGIRRSIQSYPLSGLYIDTVSNQNLGEAICARVGHCSSSFSEISRPICVRASKTASMSASVVRWEQIDMRSAVRSRIRVVIMKAMPRA
jgi:hypothetical protein